MAVVRADLAILVPVLDLKITGFCAALILDARLVDIVVDFFLGLENTYAVVVGGSNRMADKESIVAFTAVGNRIGDVSAAVQACAEGYGYGVVRELTGHGIGREMHQEPDVPNYGKAGRGARIHKGMAFCIEPMINMGKRNVVLGNDGWAVCSADGKPTAHYENTVIITDNGPEMTTYEEGLNG